jgi:hypothetical protein
LVIHLIDESDDRLQRQFIRMLIDYTGDYLGDHLVIGLLPLGIGEDGQEM